MQIKKLTKIFRTATLVACAVVTMASASWAASYYVDSVSGNDSNSGSQTAPFRSVSKVNGLSLQGGDTVYFKAGGVYGSILNPASGTSSASVTYTSYGTGNKPSIAGASITNRSYIKLTNLEFLNNGSDYPVDINNSHHVVMSNCNIVAGTSNSNAYAALFMRNSSHHNVVSGCNIQRLNTASQGDALNLYLNVSYNLIENNTIGKATHYSVFLEGATASYPSYVTSFNIIRNNKIANPEGAMVGLASQANNNLIEGNDISGGKSTSYDAGAANTLQHLCQNNIFRKNVMRDNPTSDGYGAQSIAYQYGSAPPNQILSNHVYNNLITNIYRLPIVLGNYQPDVCQVRYNKYKNNISYNNGMGDNMQVTISNDGNISDNYFQNNLFYKSGVTNILSVMGGTYSVSGMQSKDPSHWSGNLQTDPMLDTTYKPKSGSPLIDAGAHLASVTSASGSGTSFTVDDAGWFCDGFGYTTGDTIMVGSTTATIASVNNSTKTITVKAPISWTNGAAVNLPYSGSKPDIGAFEYGATAPTTTAQVSAPTNLAVR